MNTLYEEYKHSLSEEKGRRIIYLSDCTICNNTKIFMIAKIINILCKINHLSYYTQCWRFKKKVPMIEIFIIGTY